MSGPRLLVFGYSDVGHACLKFLAEREENIVAVITHADNPNEHLWFPSVKKLADQNKIPTILDPDLKNPGDLTTIRDLKPDLIFSFYYRNMIPAEVLNLPKLGAYNMHGSLLPKYRGRAPVNWAVLHGEKQTGATLHVMEVKADAGDIIDQEAVPIGPDDTAAEVQARVTQAAVKVLSRQIEPLKNGVASRQVQDASQASYFGRRSPEDGAIDWTKPAEQIHSLVRAVTHPYPGAFGNIRGVKTTIWKTRLTNRPIVTQKPGDIRKENGHFYVACGDNWLEILRLQPDGKDEINGVDHS